MIDTAEPVSSSILSGLPSTSKSTQIMVVFTLRAATFYLTKNVCEGLSKISSHFTLHLI